MPTSIDVVSPTVANEYGTYTMSFDGPQGRVNDRGNYTTVWHKIDGQWRVATDATVSSTPFPADAPRRERLSLNGHARHAVRARVRHRLD